MPHSKSIVAGLITLALAGCAGSNDLDETGGIRVVRSACPAVAIPVHTGDVTLFNPPASRDARALDVVAAITNLRNTCSDSGDNIVASATFDVVARRSGTSGAREVVLPYFATVTRGGTQVVSKQVSRIVLRFADGEARATAQGQAGATVSRAAATLPAEIQQQITRRRRAGDADASIDPMADPAVRAAISRASFELLVGFQLTNEQLGYNVTR